MNKKEFFYKKRLAKKKEEISVIKKKIEEADTENLKNVLILILNNHIAKRNRTTAVFYEMNCLLDYFYEVCKDIIQENWEIQNKNNEIINSGSSKMLTVIKEYEI